jgi:hypothetical protein
LRPEQPKQRGIFSFQGSPRFKQGAEFEHPANLLFREAGAIEPELCGKSYDKGQKCGYFVASTQQTAVFSGVWELVCPEKWGLPEGLIATL